MFTLLPPEFKKNLLKEYHFRLAIVFCFSLLVLSIISLCFLLPTYISVSAEHTKLVLEEQTLISTINEKDTDDFSKTLDVLKKDIELVSTSDNQVSPIISALYNHLIEGISVQKIDYTLLEDKSFVVNVSGVAESRKVLSTFAQELKKESLFSEVELPISNLAKEIDLQFTITMKSTKTQS